MGEHIRVANAREFRQHAAILDAARSVFLEAGYPRTTPEMVAERAGVSMDTLWLHFGSKEAVFVTVVTRLTQEVSDRIHRQAVAIPEALPTHHGLWNYLRDWARVLVDAALDPDALALRRLVTEAAHDFPELARAFQFNGPKSAVGILGARLTELDHAGLVRVADGPHTARNFNWMINRDVLQALARRREGATLEPGRRDAIASERAARFLESHRAADRFDRLNVGYRGLPVSSSR